MQVSGRAALEALAEEGQERLIPKVLRFGVLVRALLLLCPLTDPNPMEP